MKPNEYKLKYLKKNGTHSYYVQSYIPIGHDGKKGRCGRKPLDPIVKEKREKIINYINTLNIDELTTLESNLFPVDN